MGLKSRFKRFFDLEEDDPTEIVASTHEPTQTETVTRFSRNQKTNDQSKSNVVSFKTAQKRSSPIRLEPTKYEDVLTIADHLRKHQTVVFDVQHLNREEATRLIDFVSGAVYLANGTIEKINANAFLCALSEVDITSDLLKH